jgi:hypothetical protein
VLMGGRAGATSKVQTLTDENVQSLNLISSSPPIFGVPSSPPAAMPVRALLAGGLMEVIVFGYPTVPGRDEPLPSRRPLRNVSEKPYQLRCVFLWLSRFVFAWRCTRRRAPPPGGDDTQWDVHCGRVIFCCKAPRRGTLRGEGS